MVLAEEDSSVLIDTLSNTDESMSSLTDIGLWQEQLEQMERSSNKKKMDRATNANTPSLRLPPSKIPQRMNIEPTKVQRYNFMVVGPSGSGKTTFCTRALERYFPNLKLEPIEGTTKTIEERGRSEKLEGNTRIIVTVVDVPGTLDSVNYYDRFFPILEYIEKQKETYHDQELYRCPLQQEHDSRIHCCFYFIMPHRFTDLDIESMLRLQSKVALVPIVAKADTMQISELTDHLLWINNCIIKNSIQIFDFGEKQIDTAWILGDTDKKSIKGLQPLENKSYSLACAHDEDEDNLLLNQLVDYEEYNGEDEGDNKNSKNSKNNMNKNDQGKTSYVDAKNHDYGNDEDNLLLNQLVDYEEYNGEDEGDIKKSNNSKNNMNKNDQGKTSYVDAKDHDYGNDDGDNKKSQNVTSSSTCCVLVRPRIPNIFAIISGERQYIWGTASEEDPCHSDTQRLHKLLFCDGSLGKLLMHTESVQQKWYNEYKAKNEREEGTKLHAEKAKKCLRKLRVMQAAVVIPFIIMLIYFMTRYYYHSKYHSQDDSQKMKMRLYNSWEDTDETAFLHRLIVKNESEAFLAYVSSHPLLAFARSQDGRGPMWWAMEHGNMDIAHFLDANGVPFVDADANGTSPINLLMIEFEMLKHSLTAEECWFWK